MFFVRYSVRTLYLQESVSMQISCDNSSKIVQISFRYKIIHLVQKKIVYVQIVKGPLKFFFTFKNKIKKMTKLVANSVDRINFCKALVRCDGLKHHIKSDNSSDQLKSKLLLEWESNRNLFTYTSESFQI